MPTLDNSSWTQVSGDPTSMMTLSSSAWNGSYNSHDGTSYTVTGYWAFTGLSTGVTYRVGVSIPAAGDTVRYRVYDGGYPSGTIIDSELVTQATNLTPFYNLTDPGSRTVKFYELYRGTFSNSTVAVWISNQTVGGDSFVVIDAADISEPVAVTYNETGSGGARGGGLATPQRTLVPPISGGARAAGAARLPYVHVPTGGARLAGTFLGTTYTITPTGGIRGGGLATVLRTLGPVLTGGARGGGLANVGHAFSLPVGGGSRAGGSAYAQSGVITSGGILADGEAILQLAYVNYPFSGLRGGGMALVNGAWTIIPTGGAVVSGPVHSRCRNLTIEAVGVPVPRFPILLRLPQSVSSASIQDELGQVVPHKIRLTDEAGSIVELKVDLRTTPRTLRVFY